MFRKLFGKTLFSWVAALLKVSRSDYILDKYGRVDSSAHMHWHHPTHGLAQRGLVARWWFIYGIDWIYDKVYHYAMDNGIWTYDHESAETSESSHYVRWLGTVDIYGCNVLYHHHIKFMIFHWEINLNGGVDRPFPEKPVITNVFDVAKEKEVLVW